ncbi:MAG TPA: GNAT family N-acetyltransferase [Bacteroidales bacterium]|jgi:GNAT superfamily N-acetyltransferase|nr:GNAT family N-acetyltransferase [Erysipelotrichia bacterium]HPX45130.1 GNAT family N-acetyltransferase [Bacteroidales bacterium]HQA84684.1 GNAT family N-acetyltransferase [Erysipelotrichaceae bacterium]
MRIVDYYDGDLKESALKQLKKCKWTLSEILVKLIETDSFYQKLGNESKLLLLLDKDDNIISFLTLSERYIVDDASLTPWIGFVYTFEKYRGHRYSGILIEKACEIAKEKGHKKIYIATEHKGFYENFGFNYLENKNTIYNTDARIYYRNIVNLSIKKEEFSGELVEKLIPLSVIWKKEKITNGLVENTVIDFLEKDIYVVYNNNSIIGYALAKTYKESEASPTIKKNSIVYDIEEFYILPTYRNQLIGSKLYQYIEENVKDKVDVIQLISATKDYKRALNFYVEMLGMEFFTAKLFKKVR